MCGESSRVEKYSGAKKTRSRSSKKFVFSCAKNETQMTEPDSNAKANQRRQTHRKGSEQAFLNRYGRLEHVIGESEDDKVCFIHNHRIVRAFKVYINVYHLWKKWVNRTLRAAGLGGGYHTAIEVFGREYHFACCARIDAGIFESTPIHQLLDSKSSAEDFGMGEESLIGAEMASQMGPLKKRHVIGLWSGSEADFDLLLRHLKEEGNWKGPNYKLLSFNCNHFVRDACEKLLRHSKHFHPAKGMTSPERMVPPYLFKLTSFFRSRYLSCVVGNLDEDEVIPPPEEEYAFRGRARFISQHSGREFLHHTTTYVELGGGIARDGICPQRERRQSLPELRSLRVQALDQKPPLLHKRSSVSRESERRYSSSTVSIIMNSDPTDRVSWSIPEQGVLMSSSEIEEVEIVPQGSGVDGGEALKAKKLRASSARTDRIRARGKAPFVLASRRVPDIIESPHAQHPSVWNSPGFKTSCSSTTMAEAQSTVSISMEDTRDVSELGSLITSLQ